MSNIQLNNNNPKSIPSYQAGIDVGAEELVLVIRKNSKPFDPQKFTNTPADRARLVKKLATLSGIIVCMEATGVYHFDLAIALHDAGVLLMVVNPKSSHNFAKVLMKTVRRMLSMLAPWLNTQRGWTLSLGLVRPTRR